MADDRRRHAAIDPPHLGDESMPISLLMLARAKRAQIHAAPIGYLATGEHRLTSAALAALIAGGVGATLIAGLTISDIVRPVAQPTHIYNIPVPPRVEPDQPKPTSAQPDHARTAPPTHVDTSTAVVDLGGPQSVDVGPIGPPTRVDIDLPTGGGGTITPVHEPVLRNPHRDPRFARDFQPPYPVAMEREGREGRCPVRVAINASGRVTNVSDLGCDDPAFFRATERQALSRWRFTPATRDGEPIESSLDQTVVFQIPR